LKKKASQENQSSVDRFCSANEKKAKISLIVAVSVFVVLAGIVSAVAIILNSDKAVPAENMELNAAEQYLSEVTAEVSVTKANEPVPTTAVSQNKNTTPLNLKAKRGHLTGARVVDISDLKSLSDEELVDAIISGNAGVIDRSDIETDQSQNQEVVHQGTEEAAPPPQETEPDKLVNFELGIDISEFNGDIDWNAVRADGITFAFIRCGGRGWGSSGKIYEDNKLATNVRNAKAAGIKVGVYFFSQAVTPYEALEEASFTLDKIKGLGINLPVVMDWETGSGYRTWDLYGQDFANVITAFCSTIAQNGYTPCVYLNTSDINNRLGSASGSILSSYKLWYAYPYSVYDYRSDSFEHNYFEDGDTIPPRNYFFEYWQYSWHGRVSGISTDVDLNLRILGSTSLSEPTLNVTNTSVTSAPGQKVDLMNGVTATSSQDQDKTGEVKIEIKDSSNKAVTQEKAQQTVGKYTVTYSYKDSFRGTVTATATWEVKEDAAVSPTVTPSVSPSVSPSPSPSDPTDPTETTPGDPTEPSGDPTETESTETVPETEPSDSEPAIIDQPELHGEPEASDPGPSEVASGGTSSGNENGEGNT